jgi:hypothetical protein
VLALGIVLTRSLRYARADASRIMCVHNLKVLALNLKMYADEHEGQFPDKFSALYPRYFAEVYVFVCPELSARYKRERGIPHPFSPEPTPDEIDSLSSYVLVPGLTTSDDKDTVVVYEKKDSHSGMGRSLLYLDGRGAWEPPKNWRNGPPNKNLPEGFEGGRKN